MAREIEPLVFQGWRGGLSLTTDPLALEPSQLVGLTNATLGNGGELIQRKGGSERSLGIGATFRWLFHHWPPGNDGEPYLVLFFETPPGPSIGIYWTDYDGNILEDGTQEPDEVTPVTLGDAPSWPYMYWPQAVVMNSNVYIVRGKTGGNAFELVPDVAGGENEANSLTIWDLGGDTMTEFPAAGTLMVAYERIFAANMDEGSENTNDRVYFSEPLEPKTWKTTNFIDIAPDQGTAITKLVFMGDQILVFKESSVYGISGRDFSSTSDLEVYEVDGGIGCTAPATVVKTPAGLMFVDPAKGVYVYDGSAFHNVGEPIWDAVFPVLGPDVQPENMMAYYFDGHYWLRVDSSADGHGTYAMDVRTGAWSRHTLETGWVDVVTLGDEQEVLGCGVTTTDLQVMFEDSPIDPDGSVVRMEWEVAVSPGVESIHNRLQGVEATVTPAFEDDFTADDGTTLGLEFREVQSDSAFAEEHWRLSPDEDDRIVVKTNGADHNRWRSLFIKGAIPTWDDETDPDRRVTVPNLRLFVSSYPKRRRELEDATVVTSTGS